MKDLKLKFNVESNPKLLGAIQKRLFELGSEWLISAYKAIRYTDMPYLYVNKGVITYGDVESTFYEMPHKESTLDDLYRLSKKKQTFTFSNGVEVEYNDQNLTVSIDGTLFTINKSRLEGLCPARKLPIGGHEITYPTVKIGYKEFKIHEIKVLINKMNAL